MTDTETVTMTWKRKDGDVAIQTILDQVKQGDQVTAKFVRKDGYTHTITGEAWYVEGARKVVGSDDLRSRSGKVNPDLTELTAEVTLGPFAWDIAKVVMDANGYIYQRDEHNDKDWYKAGDSEPVSANTIERPIRVVIGEDNQTCLTDEEAKRITRMAKVSLDPNQGLREALGKHRQPKGFIQ